MEWIKPETKAHLVYDSICMKFKTGKVNLWCERQVLVAFGEMRNSDWGWARGEPSESASLRKIHRDVHLGFEQFFKFYHLKK